jgi:hypothetical protein
MSTAGDGTMFEIYREADQCGRSRVVYFTRLDEHKSEDEVNRGMAASALSTAF